MPNDSVAFTEYSAECLSVNYAVFMILQTLLKTKGFASQDIADLISDNCQTLIFIEKFSLKLFRKKKYIFLKKWQEIQIFGLFLGWFLVFTFSQDIW